MEILNAGEVATILKISKWQVYELAKERTRTGEVRKHPLPAVRIGACVRFNREEVERWLVKLGGPTPSMTSQAVPDSFVEQV